MKVYVECKYCAGEGMYLLETGEYCCGGGYIEIDVPIEQGVEALKKAQQFIANGTEFGYIKMPDMKIDTANLTPEIIEKAIRALEDVLK